jgi:DNA-directed RNA polymerase subunit RPC12/RpoP
VKFSCDRCGKKYATAEAPAPGRVYKLKCKACGHLIVVKTPAAGAATNPEAAVTGDGTSTRFSSISLPAAQPPEADAESGSPLSQPEAATAQLPDSPTPTPVPSRSYEPTAEISMMTPVEETRPAGDGGYVDIFADSAPPPRPPPPADDPFLKAVRASLPDAPTTPDPLVDPFADMRAELDNASAAARAANPPPATDSQPAAFAPPPPRQGEKKKGGLPVALIGIGFAAMIGIVVAVALKSGKKAEPPPSPPPPPVQVTVPVPPPEPPPPPIVAEPEKPKVEPKAQKKEEKREEKKVAKAEPPKAQPKPPPPPKPEPKGGGRVEAARPIQLQDAASALSPEAVQKVVNASRRAFEACISEAARKGTDTKFDGRKVALRLNVNPNGFVTYPTLDDVTLNRTDLGECLKAAARLMVFPKFQGDVFHVEVPLTLRGG